MKICGILFSLIIKVTTITSLTLPFGPQSLKYVLYGFLQKKKMSTSELHNSPEL